MKMTDPDRLIDEALLNKYFPGIAVQVEEKGKLIYRRVSGLASELDGVELLQNKSMFGLASLSKGLATAPVLLHLLASEGISTRESLGYFLPGCNRKQAALSLHNILLHISGLPPVPEMFKLFPSGDLCDREKAVSHLFSIIPDLPQGREMVYSCTGYILLGLVAESIGSDSLDNLFKSIILDAGGLKDLMYNPGDDMCCVTEEYDPWRKRWIKGEVHDENAWTMEGVSGNAGLFGTLDSVSSLMELYRSGGILNSSRILREEDVMSMTVRGNPPGSGLPRAYGFGCYDPDFFTGPGFSERSYGHTGFTGTSVWIDPERDLKFVLLTNRVHYGRDNTAENIKEFRKDFHHLFL